MATSAPKPFEQVITAETVSLTNCDREQVHIPSAIQPHGILFALQEPDFVIVQVSHNIESLIGLSPQAILGTSLESLVGTRVLDNLKHSLLGDFEALNPIPVELETPAGALTFEGIVHRSQDRVLFELEMIPAAGKTDFFNFYRLVKTTLIKLQKTHTLQELCKVVVEDVRHLTGYDRVMIYRFEGDGSGIVEAESVQEGLETFLGLRYPSTDIPAPARRLYLLNWLRIIPDVGYQPVALVGDEASPPLPPLDLSYSVLRSVSPLHIEYLKNMGVQASMSISLIKNGQLWGLIACHNSVPRYVSYQIRTSCEFLGQAMSLELASKEDIEDLQHRTHVQTLQTCLIDSLSTEDAFTQSLSNNASTLLELVSAQGAAIYTDDGLSLLGKTPSPKQVEALMEWVRDEIQDDLYVTQNLSEHYPPAKNYQAIASGLLALSITRLTKNYIVWFRPEVTQSVTWAGNPNKPAKVLADGSLYLTPRQSFERWQETVHGKSLPWKACEISSVFALKNAIVSTVLRQADALAELNRQLMTSNNELDAFAYAASHDLKEPLRGIHNYSNFLLEDFSNLLTEEGRGYLTGISKLAQRMESLIDSLLHYSRLGQTEIVKTPLNISELLREVTELFHVRFSKAEVKFQIEEPLPAISGNSVQLREMFTNLISNAIKYNEHHMKHIEIGLHYADQSVSEASSQAMGQTVTLYVKDNGIGIPEKHHSSIFRLFKRLHSAKKYQGGTGIGLTLVQRIVERHGGSVSLNSTPNEGSTFYITLPVES
ncbi:MAG: GAF domain-containing protein [Leptolyngbya sp. SIO1E4]|nr:GAF domain-containing protein [Leptolyngbya sp. SIO1E4]